MSNKYSNNSNANKNTGTSIHNRSQWTKEKNQGVFLKQKCYFTSNLNSRIRTDALQVTMPHVSEQLLHK